MSGSGELFLQQVRDVQSANNCGILTTARYFEPQMGRDEANAATWSEFRARMKPLAVMALEQSSVECLVVPKTVPWGMEDVTIFAGEEGRELYELDDFTDAEGESFLRTNFTLAEELLAQGDYDGIQVTIGFNRNDLSVGHHSVLKIHSHIRVVPSEIDMSRREVRDWHSLKRFDKLAFIEPFSTLHHDYIKNATSNGLFGKFLTASPEEGTGYTALHLERSESLPKMFDQLKAMYQGMKVEYRHIADIFTDGFIDPTTTKFVPRPREDRVARLEQYLQSRGDLYSARSVAVLRYLAQNIKVATPRSHDDSTDMSSTAMMYLSKGFAGALTFEFRRDSDTVRMDFLPRVITTSTPTKTMNGQASPTVIDRTALPATHEDQATMRAYHQRVVGILEAMLPAEKLTIGVL